MTKHFTTIVTVIELLQADLTKGDQPHISYCTIPSYRHKWKLNQS